jgi:hypothetical protein
MDDEYPYLNAIVLVVSSAKPVSAGYLFFSHNRGLGQL